MQRGATTVLVKGSSSGTPQITDIPISSVDVDKSDFRYDIDQSGWLDNKVIYTTALQSDKITVSTRCANSMLNQSASVTWQVVEHY